MKGLLNRDIGGVVASTTMELADLFLDKENVAIVPGEAFGAPGYARLSFALSDDDLVEGLTRIVDLVNFR
jgi:aspartate/methionine/tyrosine aminotransferase